MEADKRARPTLKSAEPISAAAWHPPTPSQLFAAGLEHRAEAVASSSNWSVDGSQWRAANFSGADSDKAELKQRQIELRRVLLRK